MGWHWEQGRVIPLASSESLTRSQGYGRYNLLLITRWHREKIREPSESKVRPLPPYPLNQGSYLLIVKVFVMEKTKIPQHLNWGYRRYRSCGPRDREEDRNCSRDKTWVYERETSLKDRREWDWIGSRILSKAREWSGEDLRKRDVRNERSDFKMKIYTR